jgi:hypothetical protein
MVVPASPESCFVVFKKRSKKIFLVVLWTKKNVSSSRVPACVGACPWARRAGWDRGRIAGGAAARKGALGSMGGCLLRLLVMGGRI